MTALNPVPAPPTAQEALAALDDVRAAFELETPPYTAKFEALRAFIESAAAEAEAWAKIEAWLEADEGREFYWSYTMGKPRLVLDTPGAKERFTTLQLAASWCEKEEA